jgi:hypothetical protein
MLKMYNSMKKNWISNFSNILKYVNSIYDYMFYFTNSNIYGKLLLIILNILLSSLMSSYIAGFSLFR